MTPKPTPEEIEDAAHYVEINYFPDHRHIPHYATVLAAAYREAAAERDSLSDTVAQQAIEFKSVWIRAELAEDRLRRAEEIIKKKDAILREIKDCFDEDNTYHPLNYVYKAVEEAIALRLEDKA